METCGGRTTRERSSSRRRVASITMAACRQLTLLSTSMLRRELVRWCVCQNVNVSSQRVLDRKRCFPFRSTRNATLWVNSRQIRKWQRNLTRSLRAHGMHPEILELETLQAKVAFHPQFEPRTLGQLATQYMSSSEVVVNFFLHKRAAWTWIVQ